MKNLPKTYHDLFPYAIGFFRIRAGYIPPKMDKPDDFHVKFEITTNRYQVVKTWRGTYIYRYPHDADDDVLGEVDVLVIRAWICFECVKEVKKFYNPDTVYIFSYLVDEYCPLCGKWCDGVPF